MPLSLVPFQNVLVKSVQAKGASERYDRAAAQGAVKWTGLQPGFLLEASTTTVLGERLDQPTEDTLTVEMSANLPVAREDTLTFDHLRLNEVTLKEESRVSNVTRRVRDVNNMEVVGLTTVVFWSNP